MLSTWVILHGSREAVGPPISPPVPLPLVSRYAKSHFTHKQLGHVTAITLLPSIPAQAKYTARCTATPARRRRVHLRAGPSPGILEPYRPHLPAGITDNMGNTISGFRANEAEIPELLNTYNTPQEPEGRNEVATPRRTPSRFPQKGLRA
jgi:hypothetical protein